MKIAFGTAVIVSTALIAEAAPVPKMSVKNAPLSDRGTQVDELRSRSGYGYEKIMGDAIRSGGRYDDEAAEATRSYFTSRFNVGELDRLQAEGFVHHGEPVIAPKREPTRRPAKEKETEKKGRGRRKTYTLDALDQKHLEESRSASPGYSASGYQQHNVMYDMVKHEEYMGDLETYQAAKPYRDQLQAQQAQLRAEQEERAADGRYNRSIRKEKMKYKKNKGSTHNEEAEHHTEYDQGGSASHEPNSFDLNVPWRDSY